MNKILEHLDYCRVKKISPKGYGFLTSLYYKENVFIHFSRIRDTEIRRKLENIERGEVYLYYTSTLKEGKRRVKKVWIDVARADKNLISTFIKKIIDELNLGNRNPFELAKVIKDLREANLMSFEQFKEVLKSNKALRTPSCIKFFLTDKEMSDSSIKELVESLEEYSEEIISKLIILVEK